MFPTNTSSFRCRSELCPLSPSRPRPARDRPALKVLPMTTMLASDLPLPRIGRGKVRDIYAVGDDRVLLLTTDRISAFDVVMAETIPMKGAVLTQISAWWFRQLEGVVHHHMISADADAIIDAGAGAAGSSRLARRPRDAVQAHHGIPDRMRDPRLSSPARPGRNMPRTARWPARSCRPACWRARNWSPRSSARRPRPRPAMTRTSRSARMREVVGDEVAVRAGEHEPRRLHARREDRPRAGHHHRRHQIRVRPRRRTAASS